jgi:hypothetical protein
MMGEPGGQSTPVSSPDRSKPTEVTDSKPKTGFSRYTDILLIYMLQPSRFIMEEGYNQLMFLSGSSIAPLIETLK